MSASFHQRVSPHKLGKIISAVHKDSSWKGKIGAYRVNLILDPLVGIKWSIAAPHVGYDTTVAGAIESVQRRIDRILAES
jgi:hypothetical protein